MRQTFAAVLIGLSAFALPALAQDIGDQREAAMKEVGRNFGVVNRMNRGQDPYDGARATQAFTAIAGAAETFATLFPEGDTGTEAAQRVAKDPADFNKRMMAFVADAKAAISRAGEGEAEFKTAFSAVQPNCGACHKIYRPD